MSELSFYRGRKVLITGHTGFKGSWLCRLLLLIGADVIGYALPAENINTLYDIVGIKKDIESIEGDIRNVQHLKDIVKKFKPEFIIHMAAQPIVRESYTNPLYTYETNIMGTANILEAIRVTNCVRSFVNVTTDKVYQNNEWLWGYRENEALNGYDPYSNSKSCSELVTSCYKNSFFKNTDIAISTARAGNVIGGGDFAKDRIIPDCIRAARDGNNIIVRNPNSIRPYQHVLDPICAYLLIAKGQYKDNVFADSYNVGPDECDCIATSELVTEFCNAWGDGVTWISKKNDGPHEANYLKLDCSKIKAAFDWKSRYNIKQAVAKTVEWTKIYFNSDDVVTCMDRQINDILSL